jgi:recombinational DNA repair protein (RecF pathway)
MRKVEQHAATATSVMLKAGFKPLEIYPGSQRPWNVECLICNTPFVTTYFKVNCGDLKRCPNCREIAATAFAKKAEEIMKAAGLTLLESYPGKNSAPWRSICNKCGEEVNPGFATVKAGGGGCKYCGIEAAAKSRVIPHDKAQDLMMKANLKPLQPYKSARSNWKCECLKCGAVVFPTYNAIQQGEGGCDKCGRAAGAKKMRTDTDIAIREMNEKGLEPLEPFVNRRTGWRSKCIKCGMIVSPSLGNVKARQKNFGCIYCMGGKVTEEDAIAIMNNAGVTPLEPYPGKDIPWSCRCVKCERKVEPTYANARRGQGGCKFCAEHGIDLVGPAYLYILQYPLHNAYKVGIGKSGATKRNDRINNLARRGWELVRKYSYETGLEAQAHEYKIFQELRVHRNIPAFLSAVEMKQTGGHTETMDADLMSLPKLIRLVEDILGRSSL